MLVKHFLDQNYVEAVEYYLKAIELDPTVPAFFSNAAAAFANIEEHERAVEMAHRAIELNSSFTKVLGHFCSFFHTSFKAYYRRAVSLMALGEYKRALRDLHLVAQATPNDFNLKEKLKECEKLNMQRAFAAALHVDEFDLDQKAIANLEIPDTYVGPRLDDFDKIPSSFLAELIEWYKLEHRLSVKVLYMVNWGLYFWLWF